MNHVSVTRRSFSRRRGCAVGAVSGAAPAQDTPRRRLISSTMNLTKMKIVVRILRPQRIMAAVLAAAALTVVSGCAARKSSFAGRFVKPGEPATSFDVQPAKPKADGLGEYARRLRTLQANADERTSRSAQRSNRKTLVSRVRFSGWRWTPRPEVTICSPTRTGKPASRITRTNTGGWRFGSTRATAVRGKGWRVYGATGAARSWRWVMRTARSIASPARPVRTTHSEPFSKRWASGSRPGVHSSLLCNSMRRPGSR